MKIIKNGVLPVDTKRFLCKECGCMFEAENTNNKKEYEKRFNQYQEEYYVSKCPCCNRRVISYT